MNSYGQYCPISRALDLLGDRWTLMILRDLVTGSERFNDLARGLPGLSRSLLSQRLRQLRSDGLVERTDDGRYRLTEAGGATREVLMSLAEWGANWAFGDPDPTELDPDLLMWWLHRGIAADRIDQHRFVTHVLFRDRSEQYWVVVEDEPSICVSDPGFGVDVTMTTSTSELYRVWLGRCDLERALHSREIELTGARGAVAAWRQSLQLSPVSHVVATT